MPRPQTHVETPELHRIKFGLAEEVQVVGEVGQPDAPGERVWRDSLDHVRIGLAGAACQTVDGLDDLLRKALLPAAGQAHPIALVFDRIVQNLDNALRLGLHPCHHA
jgi:hypothetical protein